MTHTCDRNKEILAFARMKGTDWSYQLIADHFGVSRNVVAGIVFRARHPHPERGTIGWQPSEYFPTHTAANSR